jgi:glycerol uptake facilitator-like aquaporin
VRKVVNSKVAAEFFGTFLLLASIVGSGIMATNLTNDVAVQLLVNCIAVVATLYVLITLFAPISGAQFNPIVSFFLYYKGKQDLETTLKFIGVQILGAIAGAKLAELMFHENLGTFATTERNSLGLLLGEVVASAGLILIIGFAVKDRINPAIVVPAWIAAGYFFTSSTIFANPAVTIGRSFSDSFTGIHPNSILGFIAAQFVGLILGTLLSKTFLED